MQTIGAAKFKEQCLALLDQLGRDGHVVTKHGRPAARVLPYERRFQSVIGSLRHKIEIRGNIVSTGGRWDADSEP
jgi:prevent-host-death family protein